MFDLYSDYILIMQYHPPLTSVYHWDTTHLCDVDHTQLQLTNNEGLYAVGSMSEDFIMPAVGATCGEMLNLYINTKWSRLYSLCSPPNIMIIMAFICRLWTADVTSNNIYYPLNAARAEHGHDYENHTAKVTSIVLSKYIWGIHIYIYICMYIYIIYIYIYLIIYFGVGGFRPDSISICAGSSVAGSLGVDGRS